MNRLTRIISSGFIFLFFITLVFVYSESKKTDDFPVLKGPYLGQKPPGLIPEIFAPGIISLKWSVHSSPIFSPDGREVYWSVMDNDKPIRIKVMKMENGIWTEPVDAPFLSQTTDSNPFFTHDGKKIMFKSYRENKNAIWVAQRERETWGIPKELSPMLTSFHLGWQASISQSGNVYFVLAVKGFGSHDIYKCEWNGKEYKEPEKLGSAINSEGDDWQPFVAPDESYIIFSRYYPAESTTRLFVSFRRDDGSWSDAVIMKDAINAVDAAWPYVSPDGKYFFFVSSRNNNIRHYDVYWVSAKIIQEYKGK